MIDLDSLRPRSATGQCVLAGALVAAVTQGLRVGGAIFSDADRVMALLLAVLVAAYVLGTAASLAAASLSVTAYNFFFVHPFHTFSVSDSRNVLTFVMLFGVGAAASVLVSRLRRHQAEALAREARTASLLALARELAACRDEESICRAVVAESAARLGSGAALLGPGGRAPWLAESGLGASGESSRAAAAEAVRRGGRARAGRLLAVPVMGLAEPLAVRVVSEPREGADDLADGYARMTGLALAGAREGAAAARALVHAQSEQARSALLSAVSHDLRTPLAAITSATTTLLQDGDRLDAAERREILSSARDEAERLERMVGNLLQMTRLSSGSVRPQRAWVPVEEVVGAAFARADRALAAHSVRTALSPSLPLVAVDPLLMELLLVNLLENAARHTPVGTRIVVSARVEGSQLNLAVDDAGPGLRADEATRVFEPFARGQHASVPGTGLGLAICRAVAEVHGGRIAFTASPLGGARFEVQLPSGGIPPEVPSEEAETP